MGMRIMFCETCKKRRHVRGVELQSGLLKKCHVCEREEALAAVEASLSLAMKILRRKGRAGTDGRLKLKGCCSGIVEAAEIYHEWRMRE